MDAYMHICNIVFESNEQHKTLLILLEFEMHINISNEISIKVQYEHYVLVLSCYVHTNRLHHNAFCE